jgi:hypothetical protein
VIYNNQLNYFALRSILLTVFIIIICIGVKAQAFTASRLLDIAAVPKPKFESYISKQNFISQGSDYKGDTIVREFKYRSHSKGGKKDSIDRSLTYFATKEDFSFVFVTLSANEGKRILKELKKDGFFCNNEKDSVTANCLLYQHNDFTVLVSQKPVDTLIEYSFLIKKQPLPKPKEIKFAEDLTAFTSHEYLRFYFGEQNVKTDIYYLSDTQIGKCTVLFPNTGRQAVFLWKDEMNNNLLSKIYIGGQLRTGSAVDYGQNIAENLWQLKSGVHPGMSLYTLRLLNDAAFNFYGGNNAKTGMVLTDSTGKLNFKKENIILSCMNCSDNGFLRKTVINSDEALEAERILFVHTIIIETDVNKKQLN